MSCNQRGLFWEGRGRVKVRSAIVCARETVLRVCSLQDLLVDFSTGLLPHTASAAYLGYRINHCGLTACRTIHLLLYRRRLHTSGGAYSGWRAFVSWLGWLLVLVLVLVLALVQGVVIA